MKITFDRYRAVIRYVGTEFHGFQVQPGARTVQGELCRLLGDFFGAPVIQLIPAGQGVRRQVGIQRQNLQHLRQ